MLNRLGKTYDEFPSLFWVVVGTLFIDGIGATLLFPFFALYITQKLGVGMTQGWRATGNIAPIKVGRGYPVRGLGMWLLDALSKAGHTAAVCPRADRTKQFRDRIFRFGRITFRPKLSNSH